MDHITQANFKNLLNRPLCPPIAEAIIRHQCFIRHRLVWIDHEIFAVFNFLKPYNAYLSPDEKVQRVKELYCELDEIYRTYERGDHSKFALPTNPDWPRATPHTTFKTVEPAFEDWRAQCRRLSEKSEVVEHLPQPPLTSCFKSGCENNLQSPKFCTHGLEKQYRQIGLGREELVKERNFWHPDRWSKVPEPYRQEVMNMATMIFQVLQPLCNK